MKLYFTLLSLLFVYGCGSLSGIPQLTEVNQNSSEYKPGDELTIKLNWKGKTSEIKRIELIVREYPYDVEPIPLKPVEENRKKVWVVTAPIPYESPPGVYHLEIKALDHENKQIVMPGHEENTYGKAGVIEVKII